MDTKDRTNVGGGSLATSRPESPSSMTKSHAADIVWALICLGFAFVLWEQYHQHAKQAQEWNQTATSYSNQVTALDEKLSEQALVSLTLATNLAKATMKASHDLAAIEATLSTTSSSLEKSQAAAANAEAAMEQDKEIIELENQNAKLESQNTELDKKSSDLRGALANLEAQIQSTQKKLDADEGDKKLLMDELTRLQAQKDALENKLYDLAFLRERVKTLRDDLSIARRLDWIRRGIYDAITQKGGERLSRPLLAGQPAAKNMLDMELRENGGAMIVPPPATNAPPAP